MPEKISFSELVSHPSELVKTIVDGQNDNPQSAEEANALYEMITALNG